MIRAKKLDEEVSPHDEDISGILTLITPEGDVVRLQYYDEKYFVDLHYIVVAPNPGDGFIGCWLDVPVVEADEPDSYQ